MELLGTHRIAFGAILAFEYEIVTLGMVRVAFLGLDAVPCSGRRHICIVRFIPGSARRLLE